MTLIRVAIACFSFALLISLLIAPLAQAVIQPSFYDDLTDNPSKENVVVSPPYGYFTHSKNVVEDDDDKFDSSSGIRWATTILNRNYRINATGVDGISEAAAIQNIRDAEDLWYSTLSSSSALPTATYQAIVPADASLEAGCPGPIEANSVNEIAFCDLNVSGQVTWSHVHQSGQVVTMTEADMAFRKQTIWSELTLSTVALHEFGHFYGLGDVYVNYQCGLEGLDPPVMCNGVLDTIEWGDRDGIRWLYPKLVSGQNSFSLSGTVTASDSAVALIDSNSLYDLIFLWADYNSSTDQTAIRAKVVWDISGSTGLGGTPGNAVLLSVVSGEVKDVGATLRDVGGSGTKRELVLTYVHDQTLVFTKFQVFFDLTRSGNSFTYSSSTFPQPVSGSDGDEGTDAIFFDIIQGGSTEVVVVDSFNLSLYYYYGTMDSDGTVDAWTTAGSSGTLTVFGPEIGAQVPYPSERIVTVVDQDTGNRVRERYIHFAAAGGVQGHIGSNFALGRHPVSAVTGLGAGDSVNLGEQSYREQIFSWSDSSTGYYFVDWDSRLNSHR